MAEARDRSYDVLSESFEQFREEIESLAELGTDEFKAGTVTILQDLVDLHEDTLKRLMRLEEQLDNRLGVLEAMLEDIAKGYQQKKFDRTMLV